MKNKYLIFIIVVLSLITLLSSSKKRTTFLEEKNNQENDINLTIKNTDSNNEQVINLEDYIIGVVAGEMPASFDDEALKAQAIAARTYAIYKMNSTSNTYDLTTDISNQVYITEDEMQKKWQNDFEKYFNKVRNAVIATKDLIMEYDGKVISSYYFAMSNGKTEDVSLVFGEDRDYLKSVDSSWDENTKNFEVTKELTRKEFCQKLNISCDTITISNIDKSASGRINSLTINGKNFKGTKLRTLLSLRSTDFNVEVKDTIIITTKGYGHGVGMSQYGANEMAKKGYNYEQILKHYYQNIDIKKISV